MRSGGSLGESEGAARDSGHRPRGDRKNGSASSSPAGTWDAPRGGRPPRADLSTATVGEPFEAESEYGADAAGRVTTPVPGGKITMQRRSFITAAVSLIQGAIGVVIAIPALRMLLAPLRLPSDRKSGYAVAERSYGRQETGGFTRVIALSAVPNERPVRVTVSAPRFDAYTHYPPGPIGHVWLVREADAEPPDSAAQPLGDGRAALRCFQTICPHLGCGIDLTPDGTAFLCPCHTSEFDASGHRRFGPSPRDMDELTCRVTDPDERGRRWVEVKYEEFPTGGRRATA